MRLADHLADAGVATRRAAAAMIAKGRVTVDGETVNDPAWDVTGREEIAVDGDRVGAARRPVYMVDERAAARGDRAPRTRRGRVSRRRVRDDPRLRALAVGTGVIPPRTMHSEGEAALLADLARGRRRVVEIGVFEGSSAVVLCDVLEPGAELHLVDPFGHHPNALRERAAATEWATRRVVERAAKRLGGPAVHWHVDYSASVAQSWSLPVDLVFVDGDHSEIGVMKDWDLWHPFVVEGGGVLFHDARLSQPGGQGLPGPTAVVDRLFRGPRALPDWEIDDEVDRAVAVRYAPRAA